jgi:thiamine kinase-like enzyme
MKYIDALKKYNEGKDKWCTPRKGTEDYMKILKLMNGTSASSVKKSPVAKKVPVKKVPVKKVPVKKVPVAKKSPVVSPIAKSPKRASSISPKTTLYKNATLIQRFLKNKLILTKNNLDTRVQRYHLIKKRLDKITATDCLTKKMFGKNNGYTLNGVVNLEKKIGSDSVYGVIYLSSMPDLIGSYPIASKLMKITKNNEAETKMNEWITQNLLIPKQSKHFVMIYKATKCPVTKSKDNKLVATERLVNYNELCDGDISSLMKTDVRNDEKQMINMAYQSLIAVATYQNRVGFCHNDTHWGNFLYQINNNYNENDTGYYHYICYGSDFYIKSCKYNICLFDFGLSTSMRTARNSEIAWDYKKILYGFVGSKNGGNILGKMDNNVSATMADLLSKVDTIMNRLLRGDVDDMFDTIIYEIFTNFRTDTGIFRTTKPARVLNKIPYKISQVGEYAKINFGK